MPRRVYSTASGEQASPIVISDADRDLNGASESRCRSAMLGRFKDVRFKGGDVMIWIGGGSRMRWRYLEIVAAEKDETRDATGEEYYVGTH